MPNSCMTSETTGSRIDSFDADTHDQEIKKAYYHNFDDKSIEKMLRYFRVEEDQDAFLVYLKNRKVPKTTPDDVWISLSSLPEYFQDEKEVFVCIDSKVMPKSINFRIRIFWIVVFDMVSQQLLVQLVFACASPSAPSYEGLLRGCTMK